MRQVSQKREHEIEVIKAVAARLSNQAGTPAQLAASYTDRPLDAHDRGLLAQFIERYRTPPS